MNYKNKNELVSVKVGNGTVVHFAWRNDGVVSRPICNSGGSGKVELCKGDATCLKCLAKEENAHE